MLTPANVTAQVSAVLEIPLLFVAAVLAVGRLGGEEAWFIRRRSVNLLPTSDPALAALARSTRPVVLFDGYCGLCSFWVDFVLRQDRRRRYVFSPLQSPVGEALHRAAGAPVGLVDSISLYEDGFLYQRSTAILRILKGLGGAWATTMLLVAVPATLRDLAYDFVARHRYRWFGRSDTCRVPTPEERARFI
jgi:predicted DCC family thiol-disulfide oxidoreductase YuxK